MSLVDSSVWIDYLRGTGSRADLALTALHQSATDSVHTTAPIAMELLMGPTNELALRRLERVLDAATNLTVNPEIDFHAGAEIYRAVRRNGKTIRKAMDCLIAAVAIRHDVLLLHKDADFEAIAEVTDLHHKSLRQPG